jgi:acylphosphatase
VQGVGYRYWTEDEARELGLTGWVRNRRDGSVEAVVDGSPDAVARIVQWAHRGPPASTVTQVEVSETEGAFAAFEWRPTA